MPVTIRRSTELTPSLLSRVVAHRAETHLAWVGGASDSSVFSYRIYSPVVLVEFDHQRPAGTRSLNNPRKPTRSHIRVIVRPPNGNDYGKDLPARHLRRTTH